MQLLPGALPGRDRALPRLRRAAPHLTRLAPFSLGPLAAHPRGMTTGTDSMQETLELEKERRTGQIFSGPAAITLNIFIGAVFWAAGEAASIPARSSLPRERGDCREASAASMVSMAVTKLWMNPKMKVDGAIAGSPGREMWKCEPPLDPDSNET